MEHCNLSPYQWVGQIQSLFFTNNITYILQSKIPHLTIPYINDVPVKGPKSHYIQEDGLHETIPQNPGIHCFVWEHFINLNRIVQHMKYCRGTFSGKKQWLCVPKFWVIGHYCTYEGWVADESRITAIKNWGPCHLRHYWGSQDIHSQFCSLCAQVGQINLERHSLQIQQITGHSTRRFEGCTYLFPSTLSYQLHFQFTSHPCCRHISHCSQVLPM